MVHYGWVLDEQRCLDGHVTFRVSFTIISHCLGHQAKIRSHSPPTSFPVHQYLRIEIFSSFDETSINLLGSLINMTTTPDPVLKAIVHHEQLSDQTRRASGTAPSGATVFERVRSHHASLYNTTTKALVVGHNVLQHAIDETPGTHFRAVDNMDTGSESDESDAEHLIWTSADLEDEDDPTNLAGGGAVVLNGRFVLVHDWLDEAYDGRIVRLAFGILDIYAKRGANAVTLDPGGRGSNVNYNPRASHDFKAPSAERGSQDDTGVAGACTHLHSGRRYGPRQNAASVSCLSRG